MEINGYKYITETDAINARAECAQHHGLPKNENDETLYWVNYYKAQNNNPVFWYIIYNESLNEILGEPINFTVNTSI